ncbi:MAG: hypothetical protein C4325_01505, partial [Blastocatellia bacterium]
PPVPNAPVRLFSNPAARSAAIAAIQSVNSLPSALRRCGNGLDFLGFSYIIVEPLNCEVAIQK